MRFRLAYKILCAFFLILVIVTGAFGLSRYLFSYQFRSYVYQQEMDRLASLIPVLQEAYRSYGDWQKVKYNRMFWHRLGGMEVFHPNHDGGPRPGIRSEMERPPLSPEERFPPPWPPGLFLLDAQHELVVGVSGHHDRDKLTAIQIDGKTVGWLGLQQREHLNPGPADVFMQRHLNQLYILGGVVVGLTALIAFLLSRHLLGPVQGLIRGTQELADRNFGVRIPVKTSDELGVLANHFNLLARTFEEYETVRYQWLTDISHELRTPMTVLRGEIEALCDGVYDLTPQNMASLQSEILFLSKLIDDLHMLTLADSDSLCLEKKMISPRDVLTNSVANWRARFAQRRIAIRLDSKTTHEIYIKGDAGRLGQVFTNIIENAFKYVSAPGSLEITDSRGKGHWTVVFNDSGPGVPAEALPQIFNRLYRVDPSRSRQHSGSGLGLSICKRIVELHDGSIWAQKGPNGGLFIGIKIPFA